MPIEHRRIVFSEPELLEAIRRHHMVASARLGSGEIASVAVAPDGIGVTVRLAGPQPGNAATVPVPGPFLIAALIRHCTTVGVPIPKRGRKTVTRVADGIALEIVLEVAGRPDRPKTDAA